MAALDYQLVSREMHQLMKRKNWAAKNPGVILVFAIVATVAILVTALLVSKRLAAKRAAKAG
jgi:spore maturation protein SpmA